MVIPFLCQLLSARGTSSGVAGVADKEADSEDEEEAALERYCRGVVMCLRLSPSGLGSRAHHRLRHPMG